MSLPAIDTDNPRGVDTLSAAATAPASSTDNPTGFSFDEFYRHYPRQVGEHAARKEWAKLKPSAQTTVEIFAALAEQRQWPEWQREGGRFIPEPRRWLRERRWRDKGTVAPDAAPELRAEDVKRLTRELVTKLSLPPTPEAPHADHRR